MMKRWYQGSCHCGTVTFKVHMDVAAGTGKCNCSFCWKQRNWNVGGLKPEAFELLTGEEALTSYGRESEAFSISHQFCSRCGTQTHGGGYLEELGGAFVSVRLAAINDLPVEDLVTAPVTYSDGLHDNWWNAPDEIRHL
ncbi:GFA family protein [Sphingopyxis sp. OPL5]|nr:GFA family protein [Sphingopyxis sp. OPL5]